MNAPIRFFRLSPRGAGGLACDKAGVALGDAELVRAGPNYEVAPPAVLARLLGFAYGPQPDGLVFDLHRGLGRVARALKADELALAGIEPFCLRCPIRRRTASPNSRNGDLLAKPAARAGWRPNRRPVDDRGRRRAVDTVARPGF